jgi:pyrroloquinoline quinone biosynthesis protein D
MTADNRVPDDCVPSRGADVRTRRYRGRLFIANTEQAYELNEAAEFVFRLVDGSTTVREIGVRLAAHYRYAVEDAVSDTVELISLFAERHVVEIVRDHAVAESSSQS